MTHGHHHDHPHHDHHESKGPWWKQAHRDWRIWLGVILMVVAMVVYVLSLDESMRPWGPPQQKVPAAP